MEEAMYVYMALGAGRGYQGDLCIFRSIFLWTRNCSKAKQKRKNALKEQNLLKILTLKSGSREGPENHCSWHKEKRREFIGRIFHSSRGSRIVSRGDFLHLSKGPQRGWFPPLLPERAPAGFLCHIHDLLGPVMLTNWNLSQFHSQDLSHLIGPIVDLNPLTLAVGIKSHVKWKHVTSSLWQDWISERSQRAGQYPGWCQGGPMG